MLHTAAEAILRRRQSLERGANIRDPSLLKVTLGKH
jgi:hypothetical protein